MADQEKQENQEMSMAEILSLKRIAVIGCSTNPSKPSHTVPRYLVDVGYQVFPVNPNASGSIFGQKVYASVLDIPETVDLVVIFRPASEVPMVAQEIFQRKDVRAIWMQEGITNAQVSADSRQLGLSVVEDKCIYKEHRRLTDK